MTYSLTGALYFLGIDIGATKTEALVADETGRVLGFGKSGPGNHQSVGYAGMAEALSAAAAQALTSAGLRIEQIKGVGCGIGGYDWPSQGPLMSATIRQALDLRSPPAIANDAILGLLAGTEEGWGVSLVAGTSNNCRGRDRNGREGRVTGDGSQFGEYGGAHELTMKALHAVAAAWSLRGPATQLTGALVGYLGARNVDDLFEGLALKRYKFGADAAPLVFQVAETGDLVARDVIAWSGRELGGLAVGVIRQLGFEEVRFDVVLVGGLFNGGELFLEPVRATIHAAAPQAVIKRLVVPPVVGAVVLGIEQAGFDPAPARRLLTQLRR